jgi:sec-independent protein translocase protein TatC
VVTEFNVIGLLKRPLDPYLTDGKLITLSVTTAFFITLKLAIALGLVLASPIVMYQVWAFLSPALTQRERRAIVPALYLGLILFGAGAALGYFVALPVTIEFMLGFQVESLQPAITADSYFALVTKMLLAFGVVFELPVVVLVLASLGIVTSRFLKSKRRFAVAAMAILAAVITPGDVITVTILMMVPLVLLYELSIGLARLVERGRERRATQTDAVPEAT